MAPSITTGRGAIRWTPRIATSGWLTSGVAKSPPRRPALETVNVEPRSCSGVERPGSSRGSEPRDLRRQLLDRLRRSVADDGNHEPGLGLHRDTEVDVVEVDDLVAVEAGVQRGMAAERLRCGAQHERQVAELARGSARGG